MKIVMAFLSVFILGGCVNMALVGTGLVIAGEKAIEVGEVLKK